ncbi:3',5'-cyclic-AMP phosphodiesterase [Vespertiliibacter pulmonis]|uniref:3',5'-cyclic adenosine monophosphate phosphodiesterase CpdA n=1 Tax=Vespertiliibacter pulmonis TaxID=1443036 RepID=A0A3N4VPN0_9PAST|nr:3',5'-cyclic-AMP phosphodiesterase [Vespertiliibacter pulmonis]QLB20871.1 3',5'-cyclic-AMP phosphodiesterase [Vespertiliibacter pulmonis]RPE83523.1 Icc protein [Vespertiliibacter pulmonis]
MYDFPDLKSIRILQITDPHLFTNEAGELLGVPTIQSFQAVLEAILQSSFEFDFVLATGDLVQDHHSGAYHRFAQMVKLLEKPLFWIEGNHDIQPDMSEILASYSQIQPHKQILAGEKWQLILLDSHLANVPKGELSSAELNSLAQKLAEYPDRYTLIVLHHNILPTNSAWLDQHSLANANELAEVLKPYPKVKAILHGHIHQEVDSEWQGYRILSTPSTCVQFKPNCNEFTLDPISQGWREITLHSDGRIETVVKRLDTNNFLPNFKALGY